MNNSILNKITSYAVIFLSHIPQYLILDMSILMLVVRFLKNPPWISELRKRTLLNRLVITAFFS